jgi:subtilisin family serine protease
MEVRGKHGGDSCKKSLTSVVCCALMVPSFASHCLRITLTTGGRPFLVNDIHRTPCAGVAAACGNNNAGVTGIAYRCRILPIKVWGSPNLPPLSDVADAIRYAGARAAVLSNSWTCSTSDVVRQAIQDMIGGGCGSLGAVVWARWYRLLPGIATAQSASLLVLTHPLPWAHRPTRPSAPATPVAGRDSTW